MSNQQPNPSLKNKAANATAAAKAQTTDKVVAGAQGFNQKHPQVLKSAKTINKIVAWAATLMGAKLAGFAAAFVARR